MRGPGTQSLPLRRSPIEEPGAHRPSLREGMRLGRYQLVSPLALGGMAEVWVARLMGELGFSRLVALKTIRAEHAADRSFRSSFLEEARIASRLRHANVVEVLDLGEEGPTLFLTMPLVEGESLRALLDADGAALPPPLALRIAVDMLAGLHFAHEALDEHGVPMKIVHRDVSPQNVIVGLDGIAKITDFGVAKALGRLADETEAGQFRGKIGYLAPEQVESRPLDRRTDLFGAAVVIWELLAGDRLFQAKDPFEMMYKVAKSEIAPLTRAAPAVPSHVAAAIHRALARSPEDRYATAAEMADALEAAAGAGGLDLATSRDLGAWVERVAGARIAERGRLHAVAMVRVASAVDLAPTREVELSTLSRSPRRVWRRIAWTLLALVTAAAASVLWVTREPAVMEETVSQIDAPRLEPAPVEQPPVAAPTPALSLPERTADPIEREANLGEARRKSERRRIKRRIERPPPPKPVEEREAPRPPFSNPYQR
jgi:serine/threonine-protein kinase